MEAILRGTFIEKTVTVAASTVLKEDTVLGEITATHKLQAYKSDAKDGSETPCYVLPCELKNDDATAAKDFKNVRVLAYGDVDAGKLKLAKSEDTVAAITTTLKNNGILALNIQDGIGV